MLRTYLKNHCVQDGIVVLLLGAALGVFSGYSFFHSKVKSEWILSPYLFPMLISVFALILGLCLVMEGKHQVDRQLGAEEKAPPVNLKKVAVTVAICVVYYVLVSVITFVPATAVFLLCLMWFMGERRWKLLLPVSILTPLLLYVIFAVGLSVRLP